MRALPTFAIVLGMDDEQRATAPTQADSPLKAGKAGDSIAHPAACLPVPLP
jgi:riboflavin synthase alpha subunit